MSTIEKRAANVLRNFIDKLDFIDDHIDTDDKNLSIDGYYDVYKTKEFNKENYVGSVYVQVKGCEGLKFNRNTHTYPIYKTDLKVYLDKGGIIFFVVDLKDDAKKVYYKELLPYDIQKLQENFITESKNIKFDEMKDEKMLGYITTTFIKNKELQKSAVLTNLVLQDGVVPYTTAYVPKSRELLNNILDIEQYVYCEDKVKNVRMVDKISFLSLQQERISNIKIGDQLFNKKVVVDQSKGKDVFIIDNCAHFDLSNNIVTFMLKGTLNEQLNKVDFLISVSSCSSIEIENVIRFDINSTVDSETLKQLQDRKEYLLKIKEVLQIIGITADVNLDKVKKDEKALIDKLIAYYVDKQKVLFYTQDTYGLLSFANVSFFLLFSYKEGANEIYILNKEYDKFRFALDYGGRYIEVSPFCVLPYSYILKLNYLSLDELTNNILKYIELPEQRERINLSALELIKCYDQTQNEEYLTYANKMIQKLKEVEYSDIYIINELQIKLRKEKLSEIENNSLIEIRNRNTGNNIILCGVEILLKSNAYSYYYSQLTKEEQNNFSKFPIFTLTKDIS